MAEGIDKSGKSSPVEELETKESSSDERDDDDVATVGSLGYRITDMDNNKNRSYRRKVPPICMEKPCMLGVDEAGRGPVLGPMVYAVAYCPLDSMDVLVDLGCADSKQLTEDQREAIFERINGDEPGCADIGWSVELIAPSVISAGMLQRSKCSLNEISMNSAIGLIRGAIDNGVNLAEVYVDTVGPPEKYQEKLEKLFPGIKITVAKKADSTYPIVSAASICAKVTRDVSLKIWSFPEELPHQREDFGSGYPGDPATKKFLNEDFDDMFGFPRLVRFSWSTAENALGQTCYKIEFDYPRDGTPQQNGPKLTEYFKGNTKTSILRYERSRFQRERLIDNVCEL